MSQSNARRVALSIVVTTRNNSSELAATLRSIATEAPDGSEVVVVDGSDTSVEAEAAVGGLPERLAVRFIWQKPRGVFYALNRGVAESSGRWIATITSGDMLSPGARPLLEGLDASAADAIVFAQNVADAQRRILYRFVPTASSVWPLQSVVLRAAVYARFGTFPAEYRYSADQQFLAQVRDRIHYQLRPEVLSVFCLGGLSSGVSLRHSMEIFQLRRRLGSGRAGAAWRAFATPVARRIFEKTLGQPRAAWVKHAVYRYYSGIRVE